MKSFDCASASQRIRLRPCRRFRGKGLLPLRQTGVGVMSWRAGKYRDYASECVRLAQQADSIEKRNKLLELARVWADAAVVEDQLAAEASTSKFTYRWA